MVRSRINHGLSKIQHLRVSESLRMEGESKLSAFLKGWQTGFSHKKEGEEVFFSFFQHFCPPTYQPESRSGQTFDTENIHKKTFTGGSLFPEKQMRFSLFLFRKMTRIQNIVEDSSRAEIPYTHNWRQDFMNCKKNRIAFLSRFLRQFRRKADKIVEGREEREREKNEEKHLCR